MVQDQGIEPRTRVASRPRSTAELVLHEVETASGVEPEFRWLCRPGAGPPAAPSQVVTPAGLEPAPHRLRAGPPPSEFRSFKWSGWMDSNHRPLPSEGSHLARLILHPDEVAGHPGFDPGRGGLESPLHASATRPVSGGVPGIRTRMARRAKPAGSHYAQYPVSGVPGRS